MKYTIHEPIAELRQFIKCFWTLESEEQENQARQRIVPDGCMEMIFHYGDLYQQFFEDGTSIIQPRSFVFGQISSYIEIAPTGKTGIISARFFPEGLAPFIDLPVTSLENKAVDILYVFGEPGKYLEQRVVDAGNNTARIKYIEDFLMERVKTLTTIDAIIKSCVETIVKSQGQIGVAALADKVNINRRSMERRFATAVGMSPKQLARVVRLQNTISMLEKKQFSSLTELAYENGYYDQAHFIKDFKEFTGISPKSFFETTLQLATLFIAAE